MAKTGTSLRVPADKRHSIRAIAIWDNRQENAVAHRRGRHRVSRTSHHSTLRMRVTPRRRRRLDGLRALFRIPRTA